MVKNAIIEITTKYPLISTGSRTYPIVDAKNAVIGLMKIVMVLVIRPTNIPETKLFFIIPILINFLGGDKHVRLHEKQM